MRTLHVICEGATTNRTSSSPASRRGRYRKNLSLVGRNPRARLQSKVFASVVSVTIRPKSEDLTTSSLGGCVATTSNASCVLSHRRGSVPIWEAIKRMVFCRTAMEVPAFIQPHDTRRNMAACHCRTLSLNSVTALHSKAAASDAMPVLIVAHTTCRSTPYYTNDTVFVRKATS